MAIPIIVPLIVTGVASIAAAAATSKTKPVQSSKPLQRRTKDDYAGTSFTYNKMANPVTTVNTVNKVNKVPVVEGVNTVNTMYTPRSTRYEIKPSTYNYYNDPYQINSLADVFLNKAGKELVLQDLNLAWMNRMPELIPGFSLAKTVIVGVDYLKRQWVDPIAEKGLKQGFLEAGINALISSAETLDIITNPLKGLVLDGPQGFIRGLGVGDEGRTQYDFNADFGNGWLANTGETIVNLAAEIAIDPLNWITFGTKAAVSESLTAVGKQSLKEIAEETGQAVTKKTTKQLGRNMRTIARAYLKEGTLPSDAVITALRKIPGDDVFKKALIKNLGEQVNDVSSRKIVKSAAKLFKTANDIDDAILITTPLGVGIKALGWGIGTTTKNIKDWAQNKSLRKFKKAIIDAPSVDKLFYDGFFRDTLDNVDATLTKNYNKYPVPDFNTLVDTYRTLKQQGSKLEDVNSFVRKLVDKKVITTEVGNNLVTDSAFADFFESVVQKGEALDALSTSLLDESILIDAAVNEAIKKADNVYSAIENITAVYRRFFSNINRTMGLNSIDTALSTNIRQLQEEIASLIANGINDNTVLIKQAQLKMYQDIYNNFKKQLNRLGLNLAQDLELNNPALLKQLNKRSPQKAFDLITQRQKVAQDEYKAVLDNDKALKKRLQQIKQNALDAAANTKNTYKATAGASVSYIIEQIEKKKNLKSLLKYVNTLQIDNTTRNALKDIINSLLENQNTLRILNKTNDDLNKLTAMLASTSHLKELQKDATKKSLELMNKYTNKNTDALLQAAINITDVEDLIDETKLSEQTINELKKLMNSRRYGALKNIKDLFAYLKEEKNVPEHLRGIAARIRKVNLSTNRGVEEAMTLLNETGMFEYYDIDAYHGKLINTLYPDSKKVYTLKLNQAQAHKQILEAYEQDPVMRDFINDLANDSNETIAGAVFNMIVDSNADEHLMPFDKTDIKNIKEIAKAHNAYTELLNRVLQDAAKKDPSLGLAFIDGFAGLGYRNKIDVIDSLIKDGKIDYDAVSNLIDLRYNAVVNQYCKTNESLARLFGMDTDLVRVHDAAEDLKMTAYAHQNLIDRGIVSTPKDGDIFTYYDLETTGLDVNGKDQMLQIAAHKYICKDGKLVEYSKPFNVYIKQEKGYRISKDALENFDEIFLSNVRHAKNTEQEAINAFLEYAEGTITGHNIKGFDNLLFKNRSGIDLATQFDVLDTLEQSKKLFGMRDLDKEAVYKIGNALEEYLHTIEALPMVNRAVQLVDKTAADALYSVVQDIKTALKGRLDTKYFDIKMNKNVFTESINDLLNNTELNQFAKETGPLTYKELIDVVSNLDGPIKGNIVRQVREILGTIKAQNNRFKEYIITDEVLEDLAQKIKVNPNILNELDVGLDYQLKLNAFGLTNNLISNPEGAFELTRDYQFSEIALRKINTEQYTSALSKLIEREVNEPLNIRYLVISDLNRLDSPYTDWLTKYEASERLAAYGYNYTQACRLKAALGLAAAHATSPDNLSQGILRNLAIGNDEIKMNVDYAFEWSKKAVKLDSKTYKALNQEICINDTLSTLGSGMTPQQLTAFITDKAGGLCYIGDISNPVYKKYVDQIIKDEEIYNELGYLIKREGNGLYLLPYDKGKVIANSQAVAGDYYIDHIIKPREGEIKDLFKATDKVYNKALALAGEEPVKGTQEFASKVMYIDSFYSLKRGREHIFAGTLLDDEDWVSRFYSGRVPRYSYGILGSLEGRRAFDEMYPQPLNNAMTIIEKNIKRVDGRNKFIELYFNNDLSINSKFYQDLSDEEMLETYKHLRRDNVFAVLVTDKKTNLPIVKTMRPQSVKDIQWLRKMDGVIMPTYNANMLISSINKEVFENKFNCPVLQFYYKYIVSSYKTLGLLTPGMMMRNFFDIIIKNTMGGTIDEIPESLKQFFAGIRDWKEYDAMVKEITDYYSLDANGVARYFKNKERVLGVDEARRLHDLFNEIHEYATSNVSSGMATAQEEMLKEYYNRYGSRKSLTSDEWYLEGEHPNKFDKWFFETSKLRQATDAVLKQNQYLEHGGRIASLRMSKARGLNDYEAYANALATHFDYGMKSKAQMYAELVFPFVTFPLYNLQYWIDHALKNPELIELLLDASRTTLDIEEQKQFTLENSNKLQAALLNGNVRVGDVMLKLNPSIFDAYQMVMTPSETLEQRMIAPVKLGVTKLKEVLGLNQEEETDFVYESVSNLEKLGFGKLEENLNNWGLYNLTRLTNNIIKGVAYLDNNGDLERTDTIADVLPSMFGEFKQNYGTRLGEDWHRYKYKTTTGTRYVSYQTKTGKVTSSKYYNDSNYVGGYSGSSIQPTTYPKTFPGRSYSRIPYVRRYYNNSYNWYNRWKAERLNPYYMKQPATVESLAYTFKGLLYDLDMNPKILRAYDRKQNQVLKVK